MSKLYMVVLVNYKTKKSGLREVINVDNSDKKMMFLDGKNSLIWVDEVLKLGELKDVTYNVS